MFRSIASKSIMGVRCQFFSKSARNFDKLAGTTSFGQGKLKSSLSNLDQRILVWTKKYKSIDDIPERVSFETLNQAKNRARIKTCNYMVVATVVGCIVMIVSGKRAAKRGESVQKTNLDWHKKYNEEMNAKEEAKAKKN